MDVENWILSFSYLGIFLLLIVNGIIGFPSSQIIYIIAGYFAYVGDLSFFWVVIIGGTAHAIGNIILYEVARQRGLEYILKFKIFPKKEIMKVDAVMRKKGWWFLVFGKFVNPIKIIIPIPCGMARMNRLLFGIIIWVTSVLWAVIFVSLGFYFGKTWDFAIYYGLIMLVLTVIIMAVFYRYMNSAEILKEVSKGKSK